MNNSKAIRFLKEITVASELKEMYREQESLLSNIEDNFKKQYERENKRDFTCEVDDGIEDYDNKGYYYEIYMDETERNNYNSDDNYFDKVDVKCPHCKLKYVKDIQTIPENYRVRCPYCEKQFDLYV